MKVRARDGTCRRREEEKARRERKWKKDMQVLEGILELKVANELAEFAGEFFCLVEDEPENTVPAGLLIDINESEDPAPSSSQQLPSSDSTTGPRSSMFLGSTRVGPFYESE